ncbi:MAG: sulfate permease [Anaerolineae bacterium]|nr:sulfate permease [Anaerolineae bacterium]
MLAELSPKLNIGVLLKPTLQYIQHPVDIIRSYDRSNLRPDLIAGLTVAVILLPQGIAFALIAELPPQMGLYAAIIGAIFGGLWGSSNQMHTGPANAISLLVYSTLSGLYAVGSPEYIIAAGMMALMVGLFQLAMGLARLGILINFVSHSVIVGFATGAGILIAVKQLKALFGLDFPGDTIVNTVTGTIIHFPESHIQTAVIGLSTIIFVIVLKRINPKIPSALLAIVFSSIIVYIFQLDEAGVAVIGKLSGQLPPITPLPIFNFKLIAELSQGALAIGAIGLVEAAAIARSISTQTGQRLESNQEFVGQGMANAACGIFSGFPVAGSFSRSAINFDAGARTPLASVFSAIFVLFAMLVIAPLARYIPTAALSGVLIVTAFNMINQEEIKRIWQGAPGDAAIMLLTLFGTLFLSLEFAVLLGILLSFALYVLRTSTPRVQAVVPDSGFRHFVYDPSRNPCPQLLIIEILGDLYFGAVGYVEDTILNLLEQNPTQRFLMLRMHSVDHIDFSGIHMLENLVRSYRDRGGDLFMVRVSYSVRKVMESTDFIEYLGEKNILSDDEAIRVLFHHRLDPAICIYECPHRVFMECQNLPKRMDLVSIRFTDAQDPICSMIEPHALWAAISHGNGERPFIVDVREPREFSQGHVPNALSVPLANILSNEWQIPPTQQITLVCRSGRRSRRAAIALNKKGVNTIQILEGGMAAWEAAGLLEAVEF